jgi:hypothetical protein
MSYSPDIGEQLRGVVSYVDRLLRGARVSLTESHSLLAMAAVVLLRRGTGIGWRPAAAGDVR